MNKPTKGAQSAPIPFSELQKFATKGPYQFLNTGWIFGDGPLKTPLAATNFGAHKPETSELIVRLLNFAHAGGPEAMARLIDACGWVQACGGADVKVDMTKARDALAILNGEATHEHA